MATSGSFNTTGYDGWYLTFAWSVQSQDIANNTTTISWTLKGVAKYNNAYYLTQNIKVVIDGETVYYFPKSSGQIELWHGTLVSSGTYTIKHNSDGTRQFTAYAEAGIYSWAVNCTGSGTFTLNTIPRATTPTVTGTLSLGSSITISTSGRASTSFTHNLYYSWGSQITDSLIASGVTTSKAWTIPKTLAEYIQAGTSGTMFLKCVTYNGSTAIGTKTISLTISVPNTAEFQPSISSISTAEANSLPIARYVVGKSQLTVSVTAVGAYVSGSTNRNSYLTKAVVTVDGVSYPVTLNQNSATTWSIKTNLLISAGSKSGTVTITDSRGRTASKTFSYTVYDYSVPVISSFTANRCLSNGTLDDSGTYILLGLKTTISSVDNLNAKTYKIVYENNGSEVTLKSGTLSAYTNNVLSYNSYSNGVTFSTDNSWVIRAYVYDSFNSNAPAAVTVIVPTEATFMDWRTNGKGWAFGKVSTRDAFECAWPMYDRFETLITNGMAWYTGSGDSAVDPNVTKENLILTDKNTPASGFWYIGTMFYSTKSDTANRFQIAFPYSVVSSIYTRYYYNGSWSKWTEIPAIAEAGTSGIWNYRKMANGEVELWGTYSVSNLACTTALGGWFRTPVFTPDSFPFTVNDPKMIPSYESDGYGALLWATTTTTTTKPSSFYLIRPTSATIASGRINMRVIGKWK